MNTALQATGVLLPSLSILSLLVNREVPKPYLVSTVSESEKMTFLPVPYFFC